MHIRVLLADDKEIIRQAIRRLLQDHDGIKLVGEATDFAQTIQMAKELSPDVVVMDLHMPDYRRGQLETLLPLGAAKLLAISLSNDDEAKLMAKSFGAIKLLDKMKLYDELVPAIIQFGVVAASASAGH